MPLACDSGTGLPLHSHLNMPLMSPLKVLHELVTHHATPLEIQQATTAHVNCGEGGDDESTVGIFKKVAREEYLSPRAGEKSGTAQQVTVRVLHHDLGQHILMIFMYTKCSLVERLELWDSLYYLASDMELPWLVRGDFNMILHEDEKIGGHPVYSPEYEDFAFCNLFSTTEVEHLIRTGSDHAPLLMTCGEQGSKYVKPFRFLNFWTKHATFMDVVRQNWSSDFIGDPFLMFKHKLKKVKAALSKWSRDTYGDIFKQLAILEVIVKVKNMLFEEEPTIENRIILQKAQSELKRFPTLEEVKAAIFGFNGDNVSGPDGFTGLFYQRCWEVICYDIHNMILHLYSGARM
ncbi:uncharacterized protein LOC142175819 [Nicotiana tabacum]|uniref:Uncharacterized protein LOC142175819 n=1 Tax=Nicotiana tabacum TaxID=4097 RepID=A0AC58TNY8_TOBAC